MRANKGGEGNGGERTVTEGSGGDRRGGEMKGRVFLPTYGCVPIHHFGKSGGRRMKSLSHLPLWRAEEELDRLEREKCDET